MATEILIKNDTPVVWANTADYSPGAGVIYTRTHQLDLTSLATTAARQGAKADLGTPRASAYVVRFSPAVNVAVAAGAAIYVYFGFCNYYNSQSYL